MGTWTAAWTVFRTRTSPYYLSLSTRSITSSPHRLFSAPKTTSSSSSSAKSTTNPSGTSSPAFNKILHRTPRFLRSTVSALHSAPITHITAFLLLHEVTAVVPLFGLAGAFHYYNWLPPYFAEGAWVIAGVEKFGRYFERKGWIGNAESQEAQIKAKEGEDMRQYEKTTVQKWWGRGEGGMRWVMEFATAYAIVKALLPLRIIVSVWGAPWFAQWTVIPVRNGFKRLFSRRLTKVD